MKLATICPTYLLDVVETEPFHMALAQYLLSDAEYREFYKKLGRHGCHIIVDNGAAEGLQMDFKEVYSVANYVHATEVVLPDMLRDGPGSYHLHTMAADVVPAYRRMVVPHGQDMDEWLYFAYRFVDWECSSIGIPKYVEGFEGGRDKAITDLYWRMMQKNRYHQMHLLGIKSDPKAEVIGHDPIVRSVDTGAPIAYAQHDVRIDNFRSARFSLDWEHSADRELCYININVMKEWCHAY